MKNDDKLLIVLICAFVVLLSTTVSLVKAEDPIDVSITLNVGFESQNVMKPSGLEYDFDSDYTVSEGNDYWAYNPQIKNIYIQNEITKINEYTEVFDVTEAQNGKVLAYLIMLDDNNICSDIWESEEYECYDLVIQADGVIYFNEDASYYFAGMRHLESIENLTGVETSEVINMSHLFAYAGEYSEDFTLDVSNFDTSKVTDMSKMFQSTGHNSENFTLDVSNFDTSKVIDMRYMFSGTGFNSENFTLDLSNFDTSKVTDMSFMFNSIGFNSENFTLDLSNFDTSKVTDMSYMFSHTGYNSENFTLDLSNFDTSKVTDMSYMFMMTGYNSESFTLDLSNFDTSNVTNMSYMFYHTGYNSENFTLDVRNFDTSNVTDMSDMFYYTGYNSECFTLDVSNFDTSNVIDMSWMFDGAGYNSENFTLDVSNFDTSKVTNMSYMFSHTGYNSTKLNTSITISNPNTTSYRNMFYNVATKEGSQITVNFTNVTELLVNKIIATKSEESNVVIGNCKDCGEGYIPIGTEIDINGEKFNVISQTDDAVTMLAQYNLSPDYKQSTTNNYVTFADTNGWEYTPGPKEIDIEEWSTNPKTYVNAYVEYLIEETGETNIVGNLLTINDLIKLGCVVPNDYTFQGDLSGSRQCKNSVYSNWIINNQWWWIRSAEPTDSNQVWIATAFGYLAATKMSSRNGVRPVITISKESLREITS